MPRPFRAPDRAAPPAAADAPVWRRWLLAGLGVVCVGLGAVGAIVPGLPTTIFLIAACYLFARSFPALEQRLVRTRLFRPYLRYLNGHPIPRRTRIATIAVVWVFVGLSLFLLARGGALAPWLGALIVAGAGLGTFAIATWQPRPRKRPDVP
jgi:uncharacterized membrane protein YbaN (DUF454 family)